MVTRQSQGLMKGCKLRGCGGGDGGASLCSDTNEDELKNVMLISNIISMCNISVLQILDDANLGTQKYHNLHDHGVRMVEGSFTSLNTIHAKAGNRKSHSWRTNLHVSHGKSVLNKPRPSSNGCR